MNNTIIKRAVINALSTTGYVVLIGSFFYFGPRIFAKSDSFLAPIAMLLLLVISAAVTGSLVFGLPVLWYLDGKKSEAVSLLIATLVALMIVTILVFILLFIIR